MSDASDPFDPAEVASSTAALRGVARRLVGDGAAAEDVAQQAWLVALEGGRPAEVPLRWWLRGVVRNLAFRFVRGESRRRRHESAAARPEAKPGAADDAVARAEAQRRVAEAVLALDEPYRTAVLLRYFDELTPAEIAARLGERPGTVRMRVKRGLEMLRARLDREHAGDRRNWALAFVPLLFRRLGAGSLAARTAGGLAMKAAAKAAVAAGILAAFAGGVAWWSVTRDATATRERDAVPRVAAAPRARAQPATDAAIAATPDAPSASLLVSVRGSGGAPVAGARVGTFRSRSPAVTSDDASPPESVARAVPTGDDGCATVAHVPPDTLVDVLVEAPGRASARRAVRSGAAGSVGRVDFLLARACTLRGRTIARDGSPVAGATVQAERGWPWRTESGADGRWALADLPSGACEIRAARARATPLAAARVALPLDGELDIVLAPDATLAGTVRDAATGAPLAGARVTAGVWWGWNSSGSAVSGADGRFTIDTLAEGVVNQIEAALPGYYLPSPPPGPRGLQIQVRSGETTEHDVALVRSASAGGVAGDARVAGVVRGPAGPVAGVRVSLLAGRLGRESSAVSGADGRFEIVAVEPGRGQVIVRDLPPGLYVPAQVRLQEDRDASGVSVDLACGAVAAHDVELAAGSAIVGHVVDAAGRAIEGARFGPSITDAEGRFRVDGLAPGAGATWYVEAPGFVRVLRPASAPESGESDDVVVALDRFAEVRGRVVAPPGVALPDDARVRVAARTGRASPGPSNSPDVRFSDPAPVASDGTFTAEVPWRDGGRFAVEASVVGFPPSSSGDVAIERSRDVYEVEVRLRPGVTVTGRVSDAGTGAPVGGAAVTETSSDAVVAVTAPDGSFTARALVDTAPRVGLRVRRDGFVAWETTLDTARPEPVDARLVRALEISGRVVLPDGTPVEGARVSPAVGWSGVVTAPDGSFVLRGLQPCAYSLRVSPATDESGAGIRAAEVPDVAAGTRDLRIVVRAGTRIAGRVTVEEGRGAPDTLVYAVPSGSRRGTDSPFARTGSDGSYVLQGLGDGTFDLEAVPNADSPYFRDAAGYFPAHAAGVAAGTAGANLVLRRTGLKVNGTLVSEDGRPLGGVGVEANGQVVVTAADGTFEVAGLPPGRVRIRTTPYAPSGGIAELRGGDDVAAGATDVRLVGVAGADLDAIVVGEDGAPVAGARVVVSAHGGVNRSTTTGADGACRFETLPRGTATLVADAPGRAPARVADADASRGPVRIVLARGLSATGRIVDADGRPVAAAWIALQHGEFDGVRREARTGADGTFRADGLDATPWKVVVTLHSGDSTRRADAGSIRGGATDAELRLAE